MPNVPLSIIGVLECSGAPVENTIKENLKILVTLISHCSVQWASAISEWKFGISRRQRYQDNRAVLLQVYDELSWQAADDQNMEDLL